VGIWKDLGRGPAMIATEGLTKVYGSTHALTDLTMEVRKGEVYGLLGPNGSGKTTTLRLLLGLLRPTAGRASVAGFDAWSQSLQVRSVVSYLPGELRLIGSMSGLGMLKFLSSLRGGVGLDRAVAIAERIMRLDLKRKVRNYSTGMKQKLALSQAFADPVDVLILDEPTSALDPSARNEVLNLVAGARRAGQTIIFSGHVLSEVEEISDRVAFMRESRLIHIEDMNNRQGLRMLLVKYAENPPESFPEELELTLRSRQGNVDLMEHRGQVGPLLGWLQACNVADLAIGTEDLKALYEKFHRPDVKDNDEAAPS
jgi:ABC-2 type transport system ATP-binding protein